MSTLVEKLSKLTDNLVGIVSPRRQMMREKIRTVNALRAFNGASKGRLLRDWVTSDDSADSDLKYDIEELRKRSRDLMRNDGIGAGVQKAFEDNVVGSGLRPSDWSMSPAS